VGYRQSGQETGSLNKIKALSKWRADQDCQKLLFILFNHSALKTGEPDTHNLSPLSLNDSLILWL
jgi:hypothetical protein